MWERVLDLRWIRGEIEGGKSTRFLLRRNDNVNGGREEGNTRFLAALEIGGLICTQLIT